MDGSHSILRLLLRAAHQMITNQVAIMHKLDRITPDRSSLTAPAIDSSHRTMDMLERGMGL